MPIQKQITNESMDSLNALIAQITAILNLLTSDGQSRDGFECSHSTITDAIWLLCDLVDKTKSELEKI